MENQSVVKKSLRRFFIDKNQADNNWILAQHCLEFLVYLFVVHAQQSIRSTVNFDFNLGIDIILLLLVLAAIRMITGVMVVKIVNIAVLALMVNEVSMQNLPIVAVISFLVLLLSLADVFSNVNMDFGMNSIVSESMNSTKMLHSLVFFVGILGTKVKLNEYSLLISGFLFLLLALIRSVSIMRNSNLKQLLLRLYLLVACDHFIMFIATLLTIPEAFLWVAPAIISQFLYQCYRLRKKPIKIEELYSQQKYFELTYKICAYLTGKKTQLKFEAAIEQFVGSYLENLNCQNQKSNYIYCKLTSFLEKRKSFENELLRANILLLNQYQLLKCKHIIELLRKRAGYDPIRHILLWRLEQMLFESYEKKNGQVSFQYYDSYMKCDQFRMMLIRAATHYIQFMEYSRNQDIIIAKLRKMGQRAVDYQENIKQAYEQIQQKCITTSILYAGYLYEVANDRKKAREILEHVAFNEDFQINLAINDKIFVELELDGQPLKIIKIGHNVSTILGYQRKQMEGQSYEIFLPDCYKKTHRQLVESQIDQDINVLHLYKKKTIIKNKNNYYHECDIALKMSYSLGGQMQLLGFLYVRDNKEFEWEDFILVNAKEEVLECGENMSEYQSTQNKVNNLTDIFNSQLEDNNYKLLESKGYVNLISFGMGEHLNEEVRYYVRKNTSVLGKSDGLNVDKLGSYMGAMSSIKQQSAETRQYNRSVKRVHQLIFSREYWILLVLVVVLFGGILFCQIESYIIAVSKEETQGSLHNQTAELIYWHCELTQLQLGLNYVDISQQIGYSNNFTMFNLVKNGIELHFINQRLRSFSKAYYQLTSSIDSTVSYDLDTYELTMKLIGDGYIISKFNQSDPLLKNMAIETQRNIMALLNYQALGQYQQQFMAYAQTLSQSYGIQGLILLISTGCGFILIYLLLVRAQHNIRSNQQEALTLLSNGYFQEQTIANSKQFIAKLTKEQVKVTAVMTLMGETRFTRFRKEETSFAPDYTMNDREYSKSEVSMRELSGRNLMQENTLGKSYISKQSKLRQKQSKKLVVRIARRNKIILTIPIIFILIIMVLLTVNFVINQNLKNIDQKKSAQNVVMFFQHSYLFSKGVNSFFNFLNLKLNGSTLNSSRFTTDMTALAAVQSSVQFQEVSFSEFSEFQSHLIQLQYSYLCSFVSCDSRFYNEINIIYTATIQKLLTSINSLISSYSTMSATDLASTLGTTGGLFNMNLFLYSEKVIRMCVHSVIRTYVRNYEEYSKNMRISIILMISIAVGMTVLSMLFFIALVIRIWMDQIKLARMIDVFKIDKDKMALEEKEQEQQPNKPMIQVTKVMMPS